MNKVMVLLVCLLMAGCATTHKLVSYMQSNPLVVNIAAKQAVFRYIDAGITHEAKIERAEQVREVLDKVEYFLEGNPTASSATLLLVVKSHIDLDQLSPSDRLLVEDVMTIIENNIITSEKAGLLGPDAVIRIRVLIRTLVRAAGMFA